jgi:hypothetical protein
MLYLVLFGAGVLLSMLVFGGLLGGAFQWLSRWGQRTVQFLRGGVALSSLGLGGYLLITGLRGALA